MIEKILSFFENFPPEIATFILSMLPITELRVSIPIALGVWNLNPIAVFMISIAGNIVPAFIIVWYLKPITEWFSRHSKVFEKLFSWWFERTIKKFSDQYEKHGLWALMIFVAIPLPITGAWTGALAAFLFDIPKRKAIFYIFVGLLISGFIVSLLTLSAFAMI